MRKKHGALFYTIRGAIVMVVIIGAAVAAVCGAVFSAEQGRLAENAAIVESGVRRAALQCYATEGFYPDSIDYLIERYGLFVDGEHCIVHYSSVSSNIMPDIRVIPKQES